MSVWLCRAGRVGEYETKFLEDGKIFFTFEEIADSMVSIGTKSALREYFASANPTAKEAAVKNWTAQGYTFAYNMRVGDWVVLPSKITSNIHIGRIESDYCFDEDAPESYRHSRSVEWFAEVPRSYFDKDTQTALNGPMTIYQIKQDDRLRNTVNTYNKELPPPERMFCFKT